MPATALTAQPLLRKPAGAAMAALYQLPHPQISLHETSVMAASYVQLHGPVHPAVSLQH